MAAKSAANVRTRANPPTPERRRFSLSGPSRPLDLKVNAARRDLADIKLAGRWFAPHYAVPECWTCDAAALLARPDPASETLASIAPGERFAVLEITDSWAWGFREQDDRVGYVAADRLQRPSR